ncbi:MAG: hypothetical protein LBB87_06335 [Nitrososphaerota archaeon]|jgi:hypothetical protein|nr:hypothetical protein [Nitrososphaerota archaeon]
MASDDLEGNTLSVYAYIVNSNEPVGLREITRGVEFSSSSVAYHHLQKLENLDLIEKNSYGQYSLKEKASIDGYMWVGKNLVPRLMFYSFFFIGLFIIEISIILFNLVVKRLVIDSLFLFFTGTTIVTMLLFLIEGIAMYRKLNPKRNTVKT